MDAMAEIACDDTAGSIDQDAHGLEHPHVEQPHQPGQHQAGQDRRDPRQHDPRPILPAHFLPKHAHLVLQEQREFARQDRQLFHLLFQGAGRHRFEHPVVLVLQLRDAVEAMPDLADRFPFPSLVADERVVRIAVLQRGLIAVAVHASLLPRSFRSWRA